jgi:hypothetical protein
MSVSKTFRTLVAITSAGTLAACTNMSPLQPQARPIVPNLPNGVSAEQVQQVCTDYAYQVSPNPTMDTIKDIGIPTAIGAGLGAATGALFGKNPGGGAALGGIAGAALGAGNKYLNKSDWDRAFLECQRINQYKVTTQPPVYTPYPGR